jgi:putative membrane protein
MKNINLLVPALICNFILNACNTQPKPAVDAGSLSAASPAVKSSDTAVKNPFDTVSNAITRFVLTVGTGHRMEIKLAAIAEQNAENPRVKNFGTMILKDHTKSNRKLLTLAMDNHIRIPAAVPARIQSRIDEISRYKGDEFDRRYMLLMTDQQQKSIDLFENMARHLRDTTFKDYIIKNLSLLRIHLDSAKTIKNEL